MFEFEPVQQPAAGTVADVVRDALVDPRFTEVRGAVSYVMSSGLQELEEQLNASTAKMRWLTAFDWCRSEPAALEALQARSQSDVRIHDGAAVVAKPNCVPSRSFHPKVFLFSGPEHALLLSGSANLSRNGLTSGVEFDSAIRVQAPVSARTAEWKVVDQVRGWFDREWRAARALRFLSSAYREQHERRSATGAVLDFDDPLPPPRSRGFSASDLARIAQSQVMWIESGIRNPASTQLMLRPFTRVFFGFGSLPVPRMTLIGHVTMRVDTQLVPARSLEFAHNSMDRINLPGVLPGWPARYDDKIVAFRKAPGNGYVLFDLSIPASSEVARLRAQSKRVGLTFKMSGSGREFGFV